MGSTPLTRFRMYAPFLAVIGVQALLVAIAPSTAPTAGDPAAFEGAGEQGSQSSAPGEQAAPGDADTSDGTAPDVGEGPGADDGGASPAAAGGGQAEGDGDGQGTTDAESQEGDAQAAQDEGSTDHCTEDGWQHDVHNMAPECRPVFAGQNPGATAPGVTEDEIRVVWFQDDLNPVIAEILSQVALDDSLDDMREYTEATEIYLNENYETYGRHVNLIFFHAEECPNTPPDPPACRAEVRRMIEQHDPFMMLYAQVANPVVHEEAARNGVVSVGGWHRAIEFFEGQRPFRWDFNMDGTKTGDYVGEYYCKKLAGNDATHGGSPIHPTFGLGDPPRRLGILTPESEQNVLASRHIQNLVQECSGEDSTLVTYETDVERAQEQAAAITARMIDDQVTTVLCMCDPIAPAFLTANFSTQQYYPEHLLGGVGYIDVDQVARLYDPSQWQHAFGPSHVTEPVPDEDSAKERIWRAAGNEGQSPMNGGLMSLYYPMAGSMIHYAGPELTAHNVERGMFDGPDRGGWAKTQDPQRALVSFSEGDYTALSDIREVHWDNNRPSDFDGEPGSYAPLYDGERFVRGEIPASFDVPEP